MSRHNENLKIEHVVIMNFYVVTLFEKFLKKKVATFFYVVATLIKENGSAVLSRHSKPVSRHKELKREERMSR